MKRFGFVVHPLNAAQRGILGVRTLSPRVWVDADVAAGRVARFASLTSKTGARTAGEVRSIALLPPSMLDDQARAVAKIADAARALARDGADIVGLGSLCAVVGLRGEEVARQVDVPVTTGVSYTAFAAVRTLEAAAAALGERLEGARVVVAGFPGALPAAIAEIVAAHGANLVLAGGPEKARAKLAARLGAESAAETSTAMGGAGFVLAASSAGAALEPAWLEPGIVVIDVAEPRDLKRGSAPRDVLVLDGENVSLPDGSARSFGALTRVYNWIIGQRRGTVYACFAEPIVLALEGRTESFSLGKEVPAAKAQEIGLLGERHGFVVDRLLYAGRAIPAARFAQIAALRRARAGRDAPRTRAVE